MTEMGADIRLSDVGKPKMSKTAPYEAFAGHKIATETTTGGHKELICLMEKIYGERGFDFRGYKETTLTRRLGRRLRARGVHTYTDYAGILDNDQTEYDRLFMDLTINVTSFFRDVVAFKALEEVVLPALITKGETNIRIWSAGCATGEEPYSIAILLMEYPDMDNGPRHASVLATDIDSKALEQAREGFFTPKEVEGIRPAWLERYFCAEGGGFRVKPALKILVTFEQHNLVIDPPYSGLDLIVCRNVLIYLNPMPQTQMIKGFYSALKQGGFLLLGKSEVPVGETRTLFNCLDKKAKVYQKEG
jgi:chemotaxis methyl-accepting protein methylase